MPIETLYQRWLEIDVPASAGGDRAVPMWTWPVPFSEGRALVTFLYRPLPGSGPAVRPGPQTLIVELDKHGNALPWKPAAGYPAPVIFHSNDEDELVGFDLVKKGKIYACKPDGTHLWSLETKLKMGSLIAPEFFHREGDVLLFRRDDGVLLSCTTTSTSISLPDGKPTDIAGEFPTTEAHFPHTHITRDGTIWVFDFDPMPRVTRLRILP
jgi:hypothetical protein